MHRTRDLTWDGCLNVRDLGGLPTEDGGETRFDAVVRADSIGRLSDAGWAALAGYGVRRIVDLRWRDELEGDPPRALPVEVVHVSLFGTNLSHRLVTQCYFEGDPFIAHDPIAQSIPDPRGLERLIARVNVSKTETHGDDSAVAYDWDIVLRGSRATPRES